MKKRKQLNNKIRKMVLFRDGNRCWRCGGGENLEIHHIDENPINNSLKNLITMCKSCHRPFHSNLKTQYFYVTEEGEKYVEWACKLLGFGVEK